MTQVEFAEYGPVLVVEEGDGFRVGYYDNDEWGDGDGDSGRLAVVYFSEPPLFFGGSYYLVSPESLRAVDTESLFKRREILASELHVATRSGTRESAESDEELGAYELLLEWSYLNSLLADRMFDARVNEGSVSGRRVFISHASVDKRTAVAISVDISNRGHMPWLDEWKFGPATQFR